MQMAEITPGKDPLFREGWSHRPPGLVFTKVMSLYLNGDRVFSPNVRKFFLTPYYGTELILSVGERKWTV